MTMKNAVSSVLDAMGLPQTAPVQSVPMITDDIRGTITAAVAPDKKCFNCKNSLFSGEFFYNAGMAVKGVLKRHWLCQTCLTVVGLPGQRLDRFPSATKVVVLHRSHDVVKDGPEY